MGEIVKEFHKCDVLLCIESKNYEGCWDCDELESCEKKKFFMTLKFNTVIGREGINIIDGSKNLSNANQKE